MILGLVCAGASILNFAGPCAEAKGGIILENKTDKLLLFGIYNVDNQLCSGPYAIKANSSDITALPIPGSSRPGAKVPYSVLKLPALSRFLKSTKIYISNDSSDIKELLTEDDIKALEKKGFKGFKVSAERPAITYSIYQSLEETGFITGMKASKN